METTLVSFSFNTRNLQEIEKVGGKDANFHR